MNNELILSVLTFLQLIVVITAIYEKESILNKIEEDRKTMSKQVFRQIWLGRIFMFTLPIIAIISVIYRPL